LIDITLAAIALTLLVAILRFRWDDEHCHRPTARGRLAMAVSATATRAPQDQMNVAQSQ